jgi:hypothetical protein
MNANGSRLFAVTKELWVQWQRTRDSWRDAKSVEFQHQYLEDLMSSVDKTVTVIDQIDKLMAKIKRDCE